MECVQFKVVSSAPSRSRRHRLQEVVHICRQGTGVHLYGSDAKSYVAPGGAVSSIAASNPGIGPVPAAGSKPTTQVTQPTTTAKPTTTAAATPTKMTTVTVKPTTTAASSGGSSSGTVAKYGQCGGNGYSGPTQCASGSTCKLNNEWYSQCL
ncbi:carbohydrate-binding module family 1 protein, partial [Rhizoctonia solani AG-3 Rhs1AP]